MQQPIIEKTCASFVASGSLQWKWLDAASAVRLLERIDTERLAAKGIYFDPFDLRPLAHRARHVVAAAPELPKGFDPWNVGELVENQAEETVAWSREDQAAAARFEAARNRDLLDARLSAGDRLLAIRSPFRVTVK